MSRLLPWMSVAAALVLLWWSAVDHPLYPSDEGRYATISASMAESGDWLVPTLGGKPHLTKPPLAYWLEAMGMSVFGRNELAARLPSLLAASVTLVAMFLGARSARGPSAAVCATLLYGIMPMALVVGRLGSTDAIVTALWTIALLLGCHVVSGGLRGRAARIAFWSVISLLALTKGPVAIGPLAILAVWRALARDLLSLRALAPRWGLPLSVVPVLAWSIAVALRDDITMGQLVGTWWSQSVDRASGALGKREPWWLYLPVFLLAFFPATAMLTLPWFNVTWRDAWRTLVAGTWESLLIIAVVLPLVAFSVAAGKLPTYIAPVGPPLAMLVGAMLARQWLAEVPSAPIPPEVRFTLLVCCIVAAAAFPLAALAFRRELDLTPQLVAASGLFVLPALGAAWLAARWRSGSGRRRALVVAWLGFAAAWLVAFSAENVLLERASPRRLAAAIERAAGPDAPIFTVGHTDPTRSFYRRGPVLELGGNPPPWTVNEAIMASRGAVFSVEKWRETLAERPNFELLVEKTEEVAGFPNRRYVIGRVVWRPLPTQEGTRAE